MNLNDLATILESNSNLSVEVNTSENLVRVSDHNIIVNYELEEDMIYASFGVTFNMSHVPRPKAISSASELEDHIELINELASTIIKLTELSEVLSG